MATAGLNSVDPLQALLLKHEGLRRSPYRDTAGNLTVGIGHNLSANPLTPVPVYPLTVSQCFSLLTKDIAQVEDELTLNFPFFPALDRVRQGALTDLCFNVGIRTLLGFYKFNSYMMLSNWNAAADDLLSTLYARQLPQRAADLAGMIRDGVWPK